MRARQIFMMNIIGILVVAALLVGGYFYLYNQNNYISENDAQVNVPIETVVASAAGKLTKWNVTQGSTVHAGDVLGVEQIPTGQSLNITAVEDGEVIQQNMVQGEVVGPGAFLAAIANLNNEYILANVKETAIRNVKVGDTVDIYIDAFPGTTFSGKVDSIGTLSAAQSSQLPTSQAQGNFNKEVQRIPVRISLDGKEGKMILPNMNASVRIHRNN